VPAFAAREAGRDQMRNAQGLGALDELPLAFLPSQRCAFCMRMSARAFVYLP
jgi:hypothetical protein